VLSAKFLERLEQLPPPGQGCHPFLLSLGNTGARERLPKELVHQAIRDKLDGLKGSRVVYDKEISNALEKAYAEKLERVVFTPTIPPPFEGEKARSHIINKAAGVTEADIWESSPIRLNNEPESDASLILYTLWEPDEQLFIGERYSQGVPGETILPCRKWWTIGGLQLPHIILNPLTGKPAPKRGNGVNDMTFRGTNNIACFKYAVAEFDSLSIEEQLAFWVGSKIPLVALIHSGNKSLHAWIPVSGVHTLSDWDELVRNNLYKKLLIPLGVDSACQNPDRLTRLPGYFRKDKAKVYEFPWQRLLWLNPEGGRLLV